MLNQHLENFLHSIGDTELEEAIDDLCDKLIPESAQPLEDPHTILFLTIHGSKGLTKNTVVMPGLEEAWLPGDVQGIELEENERMFYVAITRAIDCVLITYPKHRGRNDPLNYITIGRSQTCPFVRKSGLQCYYHD